MEFWKRSFAEPGALIIDDPVFGRMVHRDKLWGYVPAPGGHPFMIILDGTRRGPTKRQRTYFQSIAANLKQFEIAGAEFIREETSSATIPPLSTYSIDIGTGWHDFFTLELADETGTLHRVTFRNGHPDEYGREEN